MGNIIGSMISAIDAETNMKLIKKSKEEARNYEWLYHCTSIDALISMIKNKEMWLSNLQLVNDKEESNRIDFKDYEESFYVACFTYDSNINEDHWREYGQSDNKVLFGMKKEWFKKDLSFLNLDHTKNDWDMFKIFSSFENAIQYQMMSGNEGKVVPAPFYIIDYGFYKIMYDDELRRNIKTKSVWNIDGNSLEGIAITPSIAGIIKSTQGICFRDGKESYIKDWTAEKEVRLKIGVTTDNKQIVSSGFFFRQMSIQLTDDAFGVLPIKFSPDMKEKHKYMKLLQQLLPSTNIYEL